MNNDNTGLGKERFKYFGPVGRIAGILFIGFSLFLFVATIILIFLTKPDKEIQVPSVEGKRFLDVYNRLVRRGFKPEIKFINLYDMEDGVILDQYPESGRIVSENSTIKLTVSRSSLYMEVPNLIGVELPIALNKLRNLHYRDKTISISTGIISFLPTDKSASNIVIDQNPRAGDRITPDRKINILVSAGKVESDNIMPDVVDQSVDLCYDLLMAKGLIINEEIVISGAKEMNGIVFSQAPLKGAQLKKGDTASLKVYWYPPERHPYTAYERVEYEIPDDKAAGLYEAQIEDDHSKRIRYSRNMSPGQKIIFLFRRVGNARITFLCNKEKIRVMSIDVE